MIEGSEKLNYLTARLGDEIAHMKGKSPGFAPHWARPDQIINKLRNDVPIWVICSVFAFIAMAGYSGLNWMLTRSTRQHIHWTTQSDLHWAAAYTLAAVSGNATTLFTNEGGIQLYAGNGPLSLQAHTDQLEILADKEITVISVNEHIVINANKKITLMAGQSSVTLEGGNITFACPGKFTVKGMQHPFDMGASKPAVLGKLPDSRVKLFDEAFVLKEANSRMKCNL